MADETKKKVLTTENLQHITEMYDERYQAKSGNGPQLYVHHLTPPEGQSWLQNAGEYNSHGVSEIIIMTYRQDKYDINNDGNWGSTDFISEICHDYFVVSVKSMVKLPGIDYGTTYLSDTVLQDKVSVVGIIYLATDGDYYSQWILESYFDNTVELVETVYTIEEWLNLM